VLRLLDLSKEFILQTDACNDGVGGVLFQEEGGIKHPVFLPVRNCCQGKRITPLLKRSA